MKAYVYRRRSSVSVLEQVRWLSLVVLWTWVVLGGIGCGYDPTQGGGDDDQATQPEVGDDDTTLGDDDDTVLLGDDDTEAIGDDDTEVLGDDDTALPTPTPCVDGDGDGVCSEEDCDDGDAERYPGALEACDGVDNDCDGGIPSSELVDSDSDGSANCADCADDDPDIYPGALERSNCLDDDCDGLIPLSETVDEDGDGSPACTDCDDTNPAMFPELQEVCDGIDNNCDGVLLEGEADEDGDGAFLCGQNPDCDDTNPEVNPAMAEACDGVDNNCDGIFQEGEQDGDQDGYLSCASGELADCDDTSATTYAGAEEVCDGVDNSCDGVTDEGFDQDADGYYVCAVGELGADCDDSVASINPGAVELCDGIDNNCDGVVPSAETTDMDGDGYMTCGGADCDDGDAQINPGADEVCNGIDDDCDGAVDEEVVDGTGDGDGDGIVDCLDDCPRWVDVSGDATVADGSYPSPWTRIQDAIDAYDEGDPTACSMVEVRPGTYLENIDFHGKPVALNATKGSQAIIDGSFAGPSVQFVSGETAEAELVGFTIAGGNADVTEVGSSSYCGGGIRIWNSDPTVMGNQIQGNIGTRGAGVCILGTGAPQFKYNTLLSNLATDQGGGLYFGEGSEAHVTDNTFEANDAGTGRGGGLYCADVPSTAVAYNNTYEGNGAFSGGGVYMSSGCQVTFQADRINGNTATYGGGMSIVPPDSISINVLGGSMSGNIALDSGGGLYVESSSGSVILDSYTILNGAARLGAGVMIDYGARISIIDVGLGENEASEGGGGLYASENSRVVIRTGTFYQNQSVQGGAVYALAPYTFVLGGESSQGLEFEENQATGLGGALYLEDVNTTSDNSGVSLNMFRANTAYNGGAVASVNSSVLFRSNTVRDNLATGDQAGGVLCQGTNKLKLSAALNIFIDNVPSDFVNCQ